jgi:hypothetical protein
MGILEICENDAESKRHHYAILNLSKELRIPVEKLSASYEKKLKEIQKTAKVKDFIVLVVMHDVRETIREEISF